jgi:DNA-binding phage protein
MNNASRSHDVAVIELLREDPSFAYEYSAAAMEEANQDGGREALLAALRHVAQTQGEGAQ